MPLTEALVGWLEAQGARLDLGLHDGGHEITQAELDAVAGFLRRN